MHHMHELQLHSPTNQMPTTHLKWASSFLNVVALYNRVVAMAFPITHRAVSPIPIGLTPGHLSRAIRWQATRADVPLGSTYSEQSRLAVPASDSHRSADAV